MVDSRLSILFVEDRPEALRYLISALEREHVMVRVAADAEAAISTMCENSFDLVLLDIHIPLGRSSLVVSPFRTFVEGQEGHTVRPRPSYGQFLGAYLTKEFPDQRFAFISAVPEDFNTRIPSGCPTTPAVLSKGDSLKSLAEQIMTLAQPA